MENEFIGEDGEELEDDNDGGEEEEEDADEDDDGEEIDLSMGDEANEGENEDFQPTNPLHYLRMIRQIMRNIFRSYSGPDTDAEEETATSSSAPSPPPVSLLDERIAEEITNSTRLFPNTPARSIPTILLQREIYRKNPLSPHDRVHVAHRYLPKGGKMLFKYDHQIFCGQYSHDGSTFMSAAQDRRVRLYDTQTWKLKKEINARHIEWSVIDIDYSPDQRWIIYSSWSDYVHICNLQGDFEIHDALDFSPQAERFCLFSIKFSPDSTEILGGSSDRNIYVYDINRKERVVQVHAHADDINTVCYLDDTGNLLASGSDDNLVKVWDRRLLGANGSAPRGSGSGCVGVLAGHLQGITHVSPKGDGRYLISNGKDQCIKLWDVRRMVAPGTPIHRPSNSRGWDYRYGALANPSRMFAGTKPHPDDKSIQTYRGHRVLQTLIRSYFSPASTTGQKYIYTGSYDNCIYIYDVLSGNLVSKLCGHASLIRDLSWHPFHTQIVSTSWDGTIWKWDLDEPTEPQPPRRNNRRFWDNEM